MKMKRMLSDFVSCSKCKHEKVCKYREEVKKAEVEDPDIPGIRLEAKCDNFQDNSLFEGTNIRTPEVVTTKEFELRGDVAYVVPDACKSCPQHPSNGGSGICHCTLGLPQITC